MNEYPIVIYPIVIYIIICTYYPAVAFSICGCPEMNRLLYSQEPSISWLMVNLMMGDVLAPDGPLVKRG